LNGFLSDNAFIWPRVIAAGKNYIMRTGLLLNFLVGGAAMFVVLQLFTGVMCEPPTGLRRHVVLPGLAAVVIGGLTARCMTDAADKRFLRAAVREASGAPAAHPDTVRSMEFAPPHRVYVTALQLAVPSRRNSAR
jgi:hypothetical protein